MHDIKGGWFIAADMVSRASLVDGSTEMAEEEIKPHIHSFISNG